MWSHCHTLVIFCVAHAAAPLPLVLVHGPVRTSSLSCVEVESVHVIVLSLRVRTLPASLYASTGFNVQSTKVEALYKFMRTRRLASTDSRHTRRHIRVSPLCVLGHALGIWGVFLIFPAI